MFDGSRIVVGAGTLYAAPLGTTEPTAVTGQWPTGWQALGYTDTGSDFEITPKVAAIEVEEEYWPIRQAITSYDGSLTFALAEQTRQNLAIALNAGLGSALVSSTQSTNPDGSINQTSVPAGTEAHIMLGWDSIAEAGSSANLNTGFDYPFGRLIIRKCFQTGAMKIMRRKGNNKATYACVFSLEKPAGVEPINMIFPALLNA